MVPKRRLRLISETETEGEDLEDVIQSSDDDSYDDSFINDDEEEESNYDTVTDIDQ